MQSDHGAGCDLGLNDFTLRIPIYEYYWNLLLPLENVLLKATYALDKTINACNSIRTKS